MSIIFIWKVFEVDQSKGGEKRLLNECTRDGSVDWYGKPAVKGSTGGWRCGMLLLGMCSYSSHIIIDVINGNSYHFWFWYCSNRYPLVSETQKC